MKAKFVTVTGYFGAPIIEKAGQLAEELGLSLVILDDEIEKRDGRSIQRLVMIGGEHSYRNNEYEILNELTSRGEEMVIACGDGVLHDDDSREVIRRGDLVIVGEDMSDDELWEKAKSIPNSYHAFMSFGTENDKRLAFGKLLQRQRTLFKEER